MFEEEGLREYVGGYDDYVRQSKPAAPPKAKGKPKANPQKANKAAEKPAAKKLSYKDKLELEKLPAKIEELETRIAELHTAMGESGYFQRPAADLANDKNELTKLESDLETAFERWQELE